MLCECGETEFVVKFEGAFEARVDTEGTLRATNTMKRYAVLQIECSGCGKRYETGSFAGIDMFAFS